MFDELLFVIVARNEYGESLGTLTNPLFGPWTFESREEAESFLAAESEAGQVPPVPDGGTVSVMSIGEYNELPWATA